MDPKLIDALLRGLELRAPDEPNPIPVDFVAFADKATLVFRADWWMGEIALGSGVHVIGALPTEAPDGIWDFEHESGYVLAPATDEDVANHLHEMRLRTALHRARYLDAVQQVVESESDFDLNPWIEAILSEPEITPEALAEGETAEREVGKILVRNGDETVIDALVIDDLGNAACAEPDGFLAPFAEQWSSTAEAQRPSIPDFVRWLSQQSLYGDRELTAAGTMSASGDVQEIALQLVAG